MLIYQVFYSMRGYLLVNKKGKTALFGGSFDPPHSGHKEIVKKVLNLPGIERVIIVPAWLNPFKSRSFASPQQRLKWAKKVFDFPNVIISDFEILQKRPVYTIETWDKLKKEYPSLEYIIIGADNLANITKWKDFERLNKEAKWIVVTRDNVKLDLSKLTNAVVIKLSMPVSSTKIRSGEGFEFIDETIKDEVKNIIKDKKV